MKETGKPIRRQLSVNPEGVVPHLRDFPLLVVIRDDVLKSTEKGGHVLSEDGSDIHFLSGEGDALAYRIESYCPEDGALRARVRVPSLSADTTLYLCYGAGAVSCPDPVWDSHYALVQCNGDAIRSEPLDRVEALTVEAWVQSDRVNTDAFQVLVSRWSLRSTMDAFESCDAGETDGLDTKGYFGAVSDGRYVYFAPQCNASQERHGQVLRYDSRGGFNEPESWQGYDAGCTDGLNTKGYYGVVHAGDHIYFVPRTDGVTLHSRILRYDRRGEFRDPGSWEAYDVGRTMACQSAAYDGRYIYLSPGYEGDSGETGKALRYDTRGGFKDPDSYVIFDAGNTDGLDSKNYDGATFDGRFVYYSPLNERGIVLRHDTRAGFDDPVAWQALDASVHGLGMCVGAVFDGRYVYYVPYAHSNAVRYDTRGDFKDPEAWEAYDAAGTSGLHTKGYDGAAFDGQYVYYIPFYEGDEPQRGFHCRVLRYNTCMNFSDRAAWDAADGGVFTYPPNPGGFNGGAFDGRYVYFAPWREDPDENDDREYTPHGKVLRYDTADDASFILKYAECGHNGGLCASLPGPTFTIDTEDGTRSVRANRTLAPGRHHLAGVYDGERVTLYIDGAAVASTEASGHVQSGHTPVSVGRLAGGGAPFQGEIGEVRISTSARSDGWIDATQQNLANPMAFVRLGPEEETG
ncbi:MAG: hypothetical protein J4F39_10955 [Candidatus Latescibacteria bacterium]|nr:hypothetical protein [Candidatus Latescibacterota bacterium]